MTSGNIVPRGDNVLRATVYVDNNQYADLRRLLVLRRQSFSEWVRDKMREALVEPSTSRAHTEVIVQEDDNYANNS